MKMYNDVGELTTSLFFELKNRLMKKTFIIERHNDNKAFFANIVSKEINLLEKDGNAAAIEFKDIDEMYKVTFVESSASFFWANTKVINLYEKEERELEKYIFNEYDIEEYETGSFELTKKAFNEMLESLSGEYTYYKDDNDKNTYNYLEYLLNAGSKNGVERYPFENEYRHNYGYLYAVQRFEKIVKFRLDSEM